MATIKRGFCVLSAVIPVIGCAWTTAKVTETEAAPDLSLQPFQGVWQNVEKESKDLRAIEVDGTSEIDMAIIRKKALDVVTHALKLDSRSKGNLVYGKVLWYFV